MFFFNHIRIHKRQSLKYYRLSETSWKIHENIALWFNTSRKASSWCLLSLPTESENFPFFLQRVFSCIFPRVCARSTQKLALLRPTCKVNCDWSLTADVTEKSALEKSLAPRVIIAMIFFHLIIPLLPRSKLLFRHDWFDYLSRWHHRLHCLRCPHNQCHQLVLINFCWLHPSRRYLLLFLINFVTILPSTHN